MREKLYLRVIKGGLVPADPYCASRLRERAYKVGDLIKADLTKPRNPKFNRLVHRIGQLVVANLDAFTGMDCHKALKRIQLEGNIACEEIQVVMPNVGMVTMKIPQSLSFDSMDEGQFHEVAVAMCRHISAQYWPGCTPKQIEQMAEAMIQEAA